MLECYKRFQPKPNTIDELKKVLQTIWDDLPQSSINKAMSKDFELVWKLGACFECMVSQWNILVTSSEEQSQFIWFGSLNDWTRQDTSNWQYWRGNWCHSSGRDLSAQLATKTACRQHRSKLLVPATSAALSSTVTDVGLRTLARAFVVSRVDSFNSSILYGLQILIIFS